ncbi:MAG: protein-L-isoaspartate(D-aspartate) O-methyltransferase [Planctomycetota bacterium]|nr:protein-L-isoaspartate(D-aspartate) O-methyltransferase [Planctomycetota bacterium]
MDSAEGHHPWPDEPSPEEYAAERQRMVEEQLRRRDIVDERVLAAMAKVERHRFIPPFLRSEAYADHPVRIACGQTISQPYIVAYMTQALRLEPGMKVLEIGTGSGYQAAILAEMGAEVYTVERHRELQQCARENLRALGYRRIHFRLGDGSLGWPEEAPFARIIVTAAAPAVPPSLLAQLADAGILIAPVGDAYQYLEVVERHGDNFQTRQDLAVIFVKLIGQEGFPESAGSV